MSARIALAVLLAIDEVHDDRQTVVCIVLDVARLGMVALTAPAYPAVLVPLDKERVRLGWSDGVSSCR